MNLEELLKAYEELNLKRNAFHYAIYMIGWDSETEAPAGCFDVRSKMMGVLAGESYHLSTCEETKNLIYALYDQIDSLDEDMKLIIKKEKKGLDQMSKIPADEYIEYSMLMSQSSIIWAKAKNENDFASFAPTLEKIVAFQKKMMKYLETDTLKKLMEPHWDCSIPTRMAIIKKKTVTSLGEDVEKLEPLYTAAQNVR